MDAAALADAADPAAYERARRRAAAFYALGSRALNVVFQNDRRSLAWPRDRLMGQAARIPWIRRRMLETLVGEAPFVRQADV